MRTRVAEMTYKNFRIIVLRIGYEEIKNLNDYLCGYVVVPRDHKFYGKDYGEINDEIVYCVNGGLTYGEYGLHEYVDKLDYVIGWDYHHHWNTGRESITDVIQDAERLIDQLTEEKYYQ